MKLLRNATLAAGVAALFAAAPTFAGDNAHSRVQSDSSAVSPADANQSQSDRASSADNAERYGAQTGAPAVSGSSADESISGSTGGQGQVDSNMEPLEPSSQSGATGSAGSSASGSGEFQGSTQLGDPASRSLNDPSPSSSSSTQQ